MAIAEDLVLLEQQLQNLIKTYEQYFIGLEKREPLQLLKDVEKMIKRYANTVINNTMYKHKYNMLTARFNTYREHWNRTLKLMEEGKYARDRFISNLRQRQQPASAVKSGKSGQPAAENELDRIFKEFVDARKTCNLSVEKLTREQVQASIDKVKPALVSKYGSDSLSFRVVVEGGKPKIKASVKK